MERPVRGDVVILPFPFSDLTGTKHRPALVLAFVSEVDAILCHNTSLQVFDGHVIALSDIDSADGGPRKASHVRPIRIFTADNIMGPFKEGGFRDRIRSAPFC